MITAKQALKVAALVMAQAVATATSSPAEEIIISVEVRNYAGVQPKTLQLAQDEVTAILADAGLRVIWIDWNKDRTGNGIVIVNVLSRAPTVQPEFPAQAMGFTQVTRSAGHFTNVIMTRVETLAHNHGVNTEVLLGAAIAHEIGHLLMPHAPHTASGLMRASWSVTEYQLIESGRLRFQRFEKQILRASAEQRLSTR